VWGGVGSLWVYVGVGVLCLFVCGGKAGKAGRVVGSC
jgi:hypothetical protein